MVDITDNVITMTRGNTLKCAVTPTIDGAPYTPAVGDQVSFALKHDTKTVGRYREFTDAEPLILKDITDTMILELIPEDTKPLGFGTYAYDVDITLANGTVATPISSELKLTEEVH